MANFFCFTQKKEGIGGKKRNNMKSNYEFLMQKNATNALFEFHIKETCKNRKKFFVFMFIHGMNIMEK